MIHTYSSTIRRKEMEAVLTCMVDEKIGPGEMNTRLVQTAKELIGFDGAVALIFTPNLFPLLISSGFSKTMSSLSGITIP